MADMDIAVRFGREACDDSAAMFAGCVVGSHDLANEI